MGSPIIPFDFETNAVRVVMIEDVSWFVAVDLCRALEIASSRDAISNLDEDEKGVAITDTLGGKQTVNIVSESGLYGLSASSNKPVVKRFWKWVRSELLPALLRTGQYQIEPPRAEAPPMPVIDKHRLLINRAYLASLSDEHQATAHARAANLREIAELIEAGMRRKTAMETVSAECGIPVMTLYNHLRLIRMVPEADWPAALAPQWMKGALARLADKAALVPTVRSRHIPRPPKAAKEAA